MENIAIGLLIGFCMGCLSSAIIASCKLAEERRERDLWRWSAQQWRLQFFEALRWREESDPADWWKY